MVLSGPEEVKLKSSPYLSAALKANLEMITYVHSERTDLKHVAQLIEELPRLKRLNVKADFFGPDSFEERLSRFLNAFRGVRGLEAFRCHVVTVSVW